MSHLSLRDIIQVETWSFRGEKERERGNKERGEERGRKEKGERDGAIRYRQKNK